MARGSGLAAVLGVAPELSPPEGVEALAALYECGFLQGGLPTIGLEEELILVDRETLQPVDEIESVLAELPDERFQAEFRASQIEIVTPVFLTVADLCAELAGARRCLVEALDGRVRLLAAGTHPTSTRPVTVTEPAPLPRDRRGVPVDRPARHPERAPRPRRRGRARRGARGLQRGSRLPARGRRARRELPVLRGRRHRPCLEPHEARGRSAAVGHPARVSTPGARSPSSSSGARRASASATRPTSGGTCGRARTSARSSSASPTRRPRSSTRPRSPRSGSRSSLLSAPVFAPAAVCRRTRPT